MGISYEPLFELMKKRQVSTYQLRNLGMDPKTIQRLQQNRPITTTTLEKLCEILECQPGDIIYYVEDKKQS